MVESIFDSLNEKQSQALRVPHDTVLQVVAGPGTGKTKLLVSRVAYLLLVCKLPPSGIIVTTFTKKAANEMKERLEKMLIDHPEIDLNRLQIGTFHSICFKYLKFYGKYIGLSKNVTIADTKDQRDLITTAIKNLDLDNVKDKRNTINEVKNFILKQKASGLFPDNVVTTTDTEAQYLQIYYEYQRLLAKHSALDFDDVLLHTDKLLQVRPECVSYVKHILIDEFQDTNDIQFNLMYKLSKYCSNSITIVGDADQSIYGFRNATYANFKKVETIALQRNQRFVKISLDQNYRSTNAILQLAENLMRHQTTRENKNLVSNNNLDTPVHYIKHRDEYDESCFIANRIHKIVNDPANKYTYNDVAVIVRVSRTFLAIEIDLTRRGIPYRIVKGLSFWELKEISMAVDCLRIVALNDWLAFKRVIEWFCAGCGAKLILKIEASVYSPEINKNDNVFEIVKSYADGKLPGATAKAKQFLKNLISVIENCKLEIEQLTTLQCFEYIMTKFDLIDNVLKKKTSKKDEAEILSDINANIKELKNQIVNYDPEKDDLLQKAHEKTFIEQEMLNAGTDNKEFENINDAIVSEDSSKLKFIQQFLEHVHLAETVSSDDENDKGKVTLTTIHGSKGLEWSAVFIPSIVNNILPSKFALDQHDYFAPDSLIDEERRCFYVAITRAKEQLFLSTYDVVMNDIMVAKSSCFLDEIPKSCYKIISSFVTPSPTYGLGGMYVVQPKTFVVKKIVRHHSTTTNIPPTVLGSTGMTYNPVTGAVVRPVNNNQPTSTYIKKEENTDDQKKSNLLSTSNQIINNTLNQIPTFTKVKQEGKIYKPTVKTTDSIQNATTLAVNNMKKPTKKRLGMGRPISQYLTKKKL